MEKLYEYIYETSSMTIGNVNDQIISELAKPLDGGYEIRDSNPVQENIKSFDEIYSLRENIEIKNRDDN
jgi:hypothetical protein